MLPDKTWILRFHTLDGAIDEVEHTDEAMAFHHFNLFDSTDADVYTRVDLIEVD